MNKIKEFLKLVQENPDLPIIPMVDHDVVADDDHDWWIGEWGHSEVTEYYTGREGVHFKSDDEEDVLTDMAGCQYSMTKDGRDVYDLPDDEWNELYSSLDWKKAIVVYITI